MATPVRLANLASRTSSGGAQPEPGARLPGITSIAVRPGGGASAVRLPQGRDRSFPGPIKRNLQVPASMDSLKPTLNSADDVSTVAADR